MENYKPTSMMEATSHYDENKANRAVAFINGLKHTQGTWAGKNFKLLDWQEQIIRDLFGVVNEDGYRQFRTAYIEIPKKQGKSELAAAIALLLLAADGEKSAEVYSCAADRDQATIVFNVAVKMIEQFPDLYARCRVTKSKRLVEYVPTNSKYRVLSADAHTKHGFNVSGVIFDELHAQPNRELYDVMTKGSGDARAQPLFFLITTAGNDVHSIGYEVHMKAKDILEGRKADPSFYPVIYAAEQTDDWTDPAVWYKANPSLGVTVPFERVKAACESALQTPSEENSFRQLRLNQWVTEERRWLQATEWDKCKAAMPDLDGRPCYGGLDLSLTNDITAFVLVFPPEEENGEYYVIPNFWVPEEGMKQRVAHDHVPYDIWVREGWMNTTEGNVVHYDYIEQKISELKSRYDIREIAFDRWGAFQMAQHLTESGFTVVQFGQGYKDMSPASKELERLLLDKKIAHNGNPVLRWMVDNVALQRDAAGNIKPSKEKSFERIDGVVAMIMALDRAQKNENAEESIYDTRDLLVF